MWMERILASLRGTSGGEAPVAAPAQGTEPKPEGVANAGLRLLAVEEILEANRELVGRIKLCYGCDAATFQADLLAPIRQYLAYVNQLPASMDSYFTREGGLARIGLETAFYALQATDSQIFAGRATISNRRVLEPRWRRATFLAGLCNEMHRALSHVRVCDAKGREWQPYLMPLSHWARKHRVECAQIRWQVSHETKPLGLFALPMIVPPETMFDLAKDNATIVPHMLASIAGTTMYHEHSVMYRLVRHAAALVIHRNLRAANAVQGRPAVHMARYLIEAMRELVLSHHGWQPNIGRSRLWFGQDGLFLVWPNGVNDVIKLLQDERLPGIPDSASGVLDVLEAADLVRAQSEECRVWTIYPPGATEPLEAIKFATAFTVLGVLTPRPGPLPVLMSARPVATGTPTAQEVTGAGESEAPPAPQEQVVEEEAAPVTKNKGGKMRRECVQLSLPEMGEPPSPQEEADGQVDPQGQDRAAPSGQASKRPQKTGKSRKGGKEGASLAAPMRLNPDVAAVLAEIVGTLAGDPPAACQLDGKVLFVPLGELAKRGVDARRAQRALADAGMLAPQPDGERIHTRDVEGAKIPGLLVDARCVANVPPISQATGPDGGGDAASSL